MVIEDGVRRVVINSRYPLYEVRKGDLSYQLETALREVCVTIPEATVPEFQRKVNELMIVSLAPRSTATYSAWRGAHEGAGPVEAADLDRSCRNSYSLGMKATVSEKGQVTIPKPLRAKLGIRPGSVMEFEIEEGRLVGRKSTGHNPVDEVWGTLHLEEPVDEFIERIRGR